MSEQIEAAEIVTLQKKQVQALTGSGLDQIIYNEIGWTSRVYVVNGGEFIVKFPRREEVKKEYIQEIKIYQLLDQLDLDVQTPKLRWTHPNNEYLGYEGIPGVEYDSVAKTVDAQHQAAIGRSLGKFLKQLHVLHLDEPHLITVDDEINQFQNKYEATLPLLQTKTSEQELAKVETFIKHDMPAEMRRLGSKSVLCHGDLGYWNLILKENGHIGVIDFGDVGYYDVSKDFCGLQDKAMLNAALEAYGDKSLIRERVAIRQKAIPFLDLQYYAENNDEAKIQETFDSIKRLLNI